jgi:hypothetical protein
MSRVSALVYDSELEFYRALGLRWERGRHYRTLGVLNPDAQTVSGRPLFLADARTIEKAKTAVADYQAGQNRARVNLEELNHV